MIGWVLSGVLCVVLVAGAYHFSNVALYPQTKSMAETYEIEAEAGKIVPEVWEALSKEEVRITSPYGYELEGVYIPQEGARKTVIIVHGITFTRYGSVKYMDIFRRRGFNVLLYDNRNHGRSGGHNTSYGVYEKHDLRAWVDWVVARCGEECVIGTHGESMGAAIALQHAAIDPRIAFVVADCPFAKVWDEFTYRLKVEYHVPAFPLLPLASLITKLRAGWFFGDASPLQAVQQTETPIFFAHGQDDDYIPPEASRKLYAAKPGFKQLYLAPNADHAEAYWHNQAEYDRRVGEFLAEIGVL